MITDAQVRKLRQLLGEGHPLYRAALKVGMDTKSARKYRQADHLTGDHVEARAVSRALDVQSPQLALAQRVLLVRTDIGDGVVGAVLRVREADLLPVHDDLAHGVDLEVVDLPHQVLRHLADPLPIRLTHEGTTSMETHGGLHQPIRASSSCSTRSRACRTGMRSSTRGLGGAGQ